MSTEFEEAAKAAQEAAKAAQEASKLAGKVVDGVTKTGGFLAQFVTEPLRQISETVTDTLAVRRWENQQRLKARVLKQLKEMGDSGALPELRPIPMRVGVPLLQAAEVVEEDELQDLWANLLVNFANEKSGVPAQVSFVSTLRELSPLDAAILEKIYSLPGGPKRGILTAKLPDLVERERDPVPNTPREEPQEPARDVQLSLANLMRLGCLSPASVWGGGELYSVVYESVFGRAMYEACSKRRAETTA